MISLDNLRIQSFLDIENVSNLNFIVKPSSHVKLYLQANFKANFKDKIKDIIRTVKNSAISIEIPTNNTNSKVIFKGFIEKCKFMNSLGVNTCYIEAVSMTAKLDVDRNSRLFQDKEESISGVFKKVTSGLSTNIYYNAEVIKQGRLLLQYDETDWDFLNRVAGYNGQLIIPDYKSDKISLNYGIPYNEESVYIRAEYFETGFEMDFNSRNSYIYDGSRLSADIYYMAESYEDYDLGRKVSFKNQTLYILEKEAITREGYIIFIYKLCSKQLIRAKEQFNENITGNSITGEVVDVREEDVYIKCDIDKSGSTYPFAWLPVTGNTLYCMPEKGSKVQLYFGDRDENSINFACDILGSIKMGFANNEKGLTTQSKKAMFISKDAVKIAGNSMLSLSSSFIQLAGSDEVRITAKGNIEIKAEMISLDSEGEILIEKR
jgi:hypothetical protein